MANVDFGVSAPVFQVSCRKMLPVVDWFNQFKTILMHIAQQIQARSSDQKLEMKLGPRLWEIDVWAETHKLGCSGFLYCNNPSCQVVDLTDTVKAMSHCCALRSQVSQMKVEYTSKVRDG